MNTERSKGVNNVATIVARAAPPAISPMGTKASTKARIPRGEGALSRDKIANLSQVRASNRGYGGPGQGCRDQFRPAGGALLAYQGKNREALTDFDHCIALDAHLAAPYFNRGSVYRTLGEKVKAIADIKHFIQFEMLFRTLCEVLAVGSQSISQAYLPRDARNEFNAG
jgi:tetratricopeptide (TPR) repeat protein